MTNEVAVGQAVRAERERCAQVADGWAHSQSCTHHDDNPCCHERTGAGIAEDLRREPDRLLCSDCGQIVDPEGHRWECQRREPAP